MADGADAGIKVGSARGLGASSVGVYDSSTFQLGSVRIYCQRPRLDLGSPGSVLGLAFPFSSHKTHYVVSNGGNISMKPTERTTKRCEGPPNVYGPTTSATNIYLTASPSSQTTHGISSRKLRRYVLGPFSLMQDMVELRESTNHIVSHALVHIWKHI